MRSFRFRPAGDEVPNHKPEKISGTQSNNYVPKQQKHRPDCAAIALNYEKINSPQKTSKISLLVLTLATVIKLFTYGL